MIVDQYIHKIKNNRGIGQLLHVLQFNNIESNNVYRWHYKFLEFINNVTIIKFLQFIPFYCPHLICLYPRLSVGCTLFIHDFIDEQIQERTFHVYVRIYIKLISIFFAKDLIFISNETLRDFHRLYPVYAKLIVSKKRYAILHNVTDNEFYTKDIIEYPELNEVRLVFYGSWKGYKGFEQGLRELPNVPNLRLLIISNDPECIDIARKIINQRSLNWCVDTLENCSNHELVKAIDASHAVFYPTMLEGFGIPLLESALRRRWVIVNPTLKVAREINYGNQILINCTTEEFLQSLREKPCPNSLLINVKTPKEWCSSLSGL